MLDRLRRAGERVALAVPVGGDALQAALRERSAARKALVQDSLAAAAAEELQQGRECVRRVAYELANLPVEAGAFPDLRGNELLRYLGTPHEVTYPTGDLPAGVSLRSQWAGAVHLHSHVRTASPFGPGGDDLQAACLLQPSRYIVVSWWNGRWYLHSIAAPQGWPEDAAGLAALQDSEILRELTSRAEAWRRREDPAFIALERLARVFRLEYEREPLLR
ncbi:MAG: hypothetical protein HYU66_26705 [Armatimonadetes bacterium]|nr:hypothetical protein [Armatimonadota bacterium]